MATAKQIDFLLTGLRHPDTDEPLVGGKVYTYEAGTTTPKATYTDRDTAEGKATNPIILSATGNAEVYGNGVYKFTITDADDVTVFEFDNVEYTANITESGVGPLTSDLDFNGNKGINLGAGSKAGDTVEWQQWQDSVDALQDDINSAQSDIDGKTFISLTDTPLSYTGNNEKIPVVNESTGKLEFLTAAGIAAGITLPDLSGTPSSLGAAGTALIVASGGTEHEYGYPDAKTIQGIAVDTATPTDGQVLEFSSVANKYVPTTPSNSGALERAVVFSGSSSSVTVTSASYNGTPWMVAVTHDTNISTVFDLETAAGLGYVRILNRGGENADRVYDLSLTVSNDGGGSYTFAGRSIQKIVFISQV